MLSGYQYEEALRAKFDSPTSPLSQSEDETISPTREPSVSDFKSLPPNKELKKIRDSKRLKRNQTLEDLKKNDVRSDSINSDRTASSGTSHKERDLKHDKQLGDLTNTHDSNDNERTAADSAMTLKIDDNATAREEKCDNMTAMTAPDKCNTHNEQATSSGSRLYGKSTFKVYL